ncbi:GHMP family kinase ATP-binding protein [Corynebacterium terpenotabidum]|uniref:4-diphosphocytidyl-2-C-methyl-D-erythritol kinase n=1 Tax=Corynebacterium terpenotabidum Y-11 TaxID=1200352 RepID=S4XDQ8_9CORY|nr:4-diphosphocytidyl-2C-methyl-D-erythritol kinase [Corynebacterium terpenotabidum]AGP31287.1 4-diphosphocytidyl-2-C-methyl-D-erythritol kinase [Corynebacterium terpenotabidum Y-11]
MTSPDAAEYTGDRRHVSASAPGTVTLYLGVGDGRGPGGDHDLVTVRQALDLVETVTVTVTGRHRDGVGRCLTGISATGRDAAEVPTDSDSPVARGALAVVERYHRSAPDAPLPYLHLSVDNGVPVAGGLSGEAADVAAAMVATREILHGPGAAEEGFARATRPGDTELQDLASSLGIDVACSLLGGTVLGTCSGSGTDLVPVLSRGTRHWAFALGLRELAADDVLRRLDDQRDAAARGERPDVRVGEVTAVQRALLTDNPTELAAVLANDLQAPAVSLRPDLRHTLTAAREAGALGAVVSGAGPTVAMLCSDREHAVEVATAVAVAGHAGPTLVAASSPHGARPVP